MEELMQSILHRLEHVCLELLERVLNGNCILTAVVLLNDLFVQTVIDSPLENVRIMWRIDPITCGGVIRGSILGEKLNVFLSSCPRLIDHFPTLSRTWFQFFRFILDFFMKTFKDRQGASF
jgi:hypothetical protein